MSFVIRKGTLEDADLIRELGITTFRDTFEKDNTPENMKLYINKCFTPQRIDEELRDERSTFLLLYDNSTVAGYAKMRESDTPEELKELPAMEIERFYSIKEYIGKQVGRTLMEACLNLAVDKKYNAIWLGVWEHNPRAIAFYTKFGFEKFSEHVFMVGNDAQTDWMMKKTLVQ